MSLSLAVRKKAPSVTFTLALRFSLVLALAVLSLAVLFTFALKRYIYNSQSRELKDSAELLALALKTDAQPEQKEKIPYYITYAVYQKESQEILETNDPFLPLLEATKGKTKKFVSKNYFIDGDLRILYFAMEEESDEYGSLVIQTALNLDTDSSNLLLRGIPVIVLLAFLPVLLVSFLTALLIAKRTLAPVVKMTEAAKKISSTNLGELLPVKQKDSIADDISAGNLDELDKLAVTFNDLFVRLKKDFDRERGFTSDVSHELKTPLAVILG
ncbi:MAG: HAMP domain-containing protein, partial [Treponema sp.]|nr:HAMP domain-containing protein [Treponema sp.]